ncbi:MAG TPA: Holliday junction branch migration protein RuvA [Selenomonadales bacterium]|nr:Holliday junction branch migration protein RuvA [Selenomonadales bacterium]
MIGYLRGTVTHLQVESCFINVQGVGYRVFIPNSTRQELAVDKPVTLFTHLNVREDALLLYGFYSQAEYDLFQQLITITGIGPKVALGVLSAVTPTEFCAAVSQKNAVLLTRIPGIGKKTAERLILELKDKLGLPDELLSSPAKSPTGAGAVFQDPAQEALAALVALGYSQGEIAPVLGRIKAEGQSVEELIKLTLKEFARR